MAKSRSNSRRHHGDPGISLEDAVNEVGMMVEDAIDFVASELEPQWQLAELYYNGYTELEEFEGRSTVTKTEVRDAIRNTMPSVMRVLASSTKIVEYIPSSVQHGMWVDLQAQFVRHLFFKNNGYYVLYAAALEALKLKSGIIKVWWEPDTTPEYTQYTKVPFSVVEQLANDPLIEILDFIEAENTLIGLEDVAVYDVEFVRHHENGSIMMEHVPNYEFFISRNASNIEDAIQRGVHGQQQIVTVNEAIQMGLDYDDWIKLDAEDPELSDFGGSSQERRGNSKDDPNDMDSLDVLRHEFLLTEAYVSYDLDNSGTTQLYRFYLGGTSYEYLDHTRVQDSPFSMANPIPIPSYPYGHSIADLTINEQDASTSLLRAAIDNAHASNDAKFVADPTKVDFDDLMNPAINAPVRARHGSQVQTIQVPFTAQGTMTVLQYLDLDVQNKIGITKAAQGLDPDALQSTDKQAVLNTIQTSQGQTELMVRNIVETALIRVFRQLLKLTIQHQSPIQMMLVKGKPLPIDTRMFDPDATALPNVGIGTASPAQKQAALTGVIQRQEQYLQQYGPNNPFTSYAQLYNALEDLLEANGIYNTERYFNVVTPQVEQQWGAAEQKKLEEQQRIAQENKPMDPSKAFMQVEQQKREAERLRIITDARTAERKLQLDATKADEQNDIARDKLIQERVIKLAEISKTNEDEAIKKEQQENDDKAVSGKRQRGGTKDRKRSGLSGPGDTSPPDSATGTS